MTLYPLKFGHELGHKAGSLLTESIGPKESIAIFARSCRYGLTMRVLPTERPRPDRPFSQPVPFV